MTLEILSDVFFESLQEDLVVNFVLLTPLLETGRLICIDKDRFRGAIVEWLGTPFLERQNIKNPERECKYYAPHSGLVFQL